MMFIKKTTLSII